MSSPAPYFDLIREMKDAYNHRLRLVDYARHHGIKAAARAALLKLREFGGGIGYVCLGSEGAPRLDGPRRQMRKIS